MIPKHWPRVTSRCGVAQHQAVVCPLSEIPECARYNWLAHKYLNETILNTFFWNECVYNIPERCLYCLSGTQIFRITMEHLLQECVYSLKQKDEVHWCKCFKSVHPPAISVIKSDWLIFYDDISAEIMYMKSAHLLLMSTWQRRYGFKVCLACKPIRCCIRAWWAGLLLTCWFFQQYRFLHGQNGVLSKTIPDPIDMEFNKQ